MDVRFLFCIGIKNCRSCVYPDYTMKYQNVKRGCPTGSIKGELKIIKQSIKKTTSLEVIDRCALFMYNIL